MYNLLFDSDALIKISKIDFLDIIADKFSIVITEEVYQETVTEGKKGLYLDADKIENLVQDGKIKIIKKGYYEKSKKPKQIFGIGEISVFQSHKRNIIIVTDDLKFTSYLRKEKISSLSSAHLIYILAKNRELGKEKAYDFLEKLRPYIRNDLYNSVKMDIGE